jgi:BrxA
MGLAAADGLGAADNMPTPPPRYTSRIQKGGALFEEMRQLVLLWKDVPLRQNKAGVIRVNPLNKATRARVVDVLNRIFVPRFVEGPIRNGWKLLVPLEKLHVSPAIVRPIYFWLTALGEPLMYDLCTQYLSSRRVQGLLAINVNEAAAWIEARGCGWSEVVTIKVTRALLAALRDFGLLEGKARKHLASPPLPLPSFAYLSFCLYQSGVAVRNMLTHPDWKLFMLTPADVEHFLLESHQQRFLEYHAAGSVVSLSFPVSTAEEYAHVVLGR